MNLINNPKSRHDDVVIQDLENELLIYDLKLNKAFCLNETSALIWRFCDGNNSIAEINQLLSEQLKLPVSEDIVWLALDQLKQDNLLANGDEIKFNGLSRRAVIRKAGVASMIALPIVASLIAPRSIDAQSGACGFGAACSCTVSNPVNATTGVNCRTLGGNPSGCGSSLSCDCQVTAGSSQGGCIGV